MIWFLLQLFTRQLLALSTASVAPRATEDLHPLLSPWQPKATMTQFDPEVLPINPDLQICHHRR